MGGDTKVLQNESRRATSEDISNNVVEAAKKSSSANKVTASLAQLHLNGMKLHGREDDMKVLKSKLFDIKNDKKKKIGVATSSRRIIGEDMTLAHEGKLPEIVLVAGISGTGKSALVMKGLKEPAARLGITFAGGKFDLNHAALPLSAFVDAMACLTGVIMTKTIEAEKIKSDIKDSFVKEDMMLLIRALPDCELLFPHLKKKHSNDEADIILGGKDAVLRLQYAIRRLLQIICSNLNGVVLFIDDLQWADIATLDLLQSIALDDEIPNLLIVGAYREDEVPDSHPLALHLRELEETGIELTTIKIDNLSAANVKALVADALS